MTKKELLEAIEDMPEDAKIGVKYVLYDGKTKILATDVECDMEFNEIMIC